MSLPLKVQRSEPYLQVGEEVDGLGQRDEPVFVQHQLLQLATPEATDRHNLNMRWQNTKFAEAGRRSSKGAASLKSLWPSGARAHLRCWKCRHEGNVCAGISPAESLWDELQVVVSSHELCEAGEFANAGRNPVEVQLVRVDVQLLQFRQLTDCRLDGRKM